MQYPKLRPAAKCRPRSTTELGHDRPREPNALKGRSAPFQQGKNQKIVTAMPIFSRFYRLHLSSDQAFTQSQPTVLTSDGADAEEILVLKN